MNELDLFAAAIGLTDPGERASFLDRECDGQHEVRLRLEQLLEAHFRSNELLDSPTTDSSANKDAGPTADYAAPVEKGVIVAGRYKLLQQIGEGGMGSVWMADQTEPIKRRVAVKLIRVDRGQSKTILSRFEAERQAIALMDHPNIAKLLDAGTTGSGAPYFVMELIKGVPLTEFCDAHRLSVPERLQLFMQVCSAVQHAHQKGVIHRDLKPTNVLVENHDGKGVPKVIDFGLAKATTGLQLTDNTLFTAFGSVMGTPLYMAPEQANFNAVDVDTRADVYALGVILYELLTGTTPLTKESIKKAQLDELLRLVREQEPPTPSSRLSTADSAPSVAANRQMEPAKLGGLVRGELDWIVMKALAKERDQRYETANGFARDVERFLNQEPVQAGPPSAGYKLRKFIQRNRGQVIAVGLVVGALIAGVVGTTLALFEARRQQGFAEVNERKALGAAHEERQAKQREAAQLAVAVEQRAKAEKARDRTREALDAMTSSVAGDSLSTQQEISPDQKVFLTEVLTYYREFAGERPDDKRSRARSANAAYRVGMIETRLGRREQAIAALQIARDAYRSLAADFPAVLPYREVLADCHSALGQVLSHLRRWTESVEHARAALAIRKSLDADFPGTPKHQTSLSAAESNLGIVLNILGESREAEEHIRQAVALSEKLVADSPTVPTYRDRLALSHHNLGIVAQADPKKRPEAAKHFRKGLAVRVKLAADYPAEPKYQEVLAISHQDLAHLLSELGKSAEAEKHYRQALAIREKLAAQFPAMPGYRHALSRSQNSLGAVLARQGRGAESEERIRKGLAIREKLVADFPNAPQYKIDLGYACYNYGLAVYNKGRLSESLSWFDKTIAVLDQMDRAGSPDVNVKKLLINSHWNRAAVYDELGKHVEAIKDWDRAIELSSPANRMDYQVRRARSHLMGGKVDAAMTDLAKVESAAGPLDARKWTVNQWYDFACVHAIASAKVATRKKEYADKAMVLLNKAVRAGWKDAATLKKDKDVDALRGREDFKKLQLEVESESSSAPYSATKQENKK